MTEQEILNGKFIFVSYTHADMDIVKNDVEAIQSDGARIWFDTNMEIGDNWKSVAESKIKHPNCVGVIFYVSPKALASKAVQDEQKWTSERLKEDKDFSYWFVNHMNKKMDDLFEMAGYVYEAVSKGSYSEIERKQRELFNDEVIHVKETDPEARQKILYDLALKYGAVNNEYAIVSEGYGTFALGSFIKSETDEFPGEGKENGKYNFGNKEFVVIDGKSYTSEPLKWTILRKNEDGSYVYVCNSIVCIKAFTNLEKYLKNVFEEVAFTKEEKECFVGEHVRLVNDDDLNYLGEKQERMLRMNPEPSIHWWVSSEGVMKGWKKTCFEGLPFKNGFPQHLEKGVRPVIIIDAEKIKNILKNK